MSRCPGRPAAPRDELLEDILELADLLGGRPLLKHVDEWGRWSHQTYYTHFGSWTEALEEAEVGHLDKVSLRVPSEIDRPEASAVDLPTEVLLDDVERVAEELARMPQRRVYRKLGLFPADEVAERFDGTWYLVSKELGYEPPGGGSAWTAARLERMEPEEVGLSAVGDRKIADGGDR